MWMVLENTECCYDQKYAVSVECWTHRCYCCKLVNIVINDNFQTPKVQMFSEHKIPTIYEFIYCMQIYWSWGAIYSVLGNTNSLRASSYVSTAHPFN